LRNTLLIIGSLIVSLLIVELASRMAGFEPRTLAVNDFFVDGLDTTWSMPDSELGWINKPGTSVSMEFGNAPMTFWDNGRRASRGAVAVPPHAASIMIVGGSNAQAYGVIDQESFAYKLAKRFPYLWFENFGNGGYSTVQALLLSERELSDIYGATKPDLIVLTFADSHVNRNVSDQSWIYSISDSQGRYVAPPHFRLTNGELDFTPFETIEPWPFETSSAALTLLHNIWLQSVAYNTADQGIDVTRMVFKRFEELVKGSGAELLVAVLEDRSQISGSVFDGLSLNIVDCSGYERDSRADYLLGGNGHPNARYHTHFAECIGGWIEQKSALTAQALKAAAVSDE